MNFFEFNLNSNEDSINSRFIIRKIDKEVEDKQDKAETQMVQYNKSASLPVAVNIIMYILAFVAIVCIGGIVKAIVDTPWEQVVENGGVWFLAVGAASALVAAAIFLYGKKKSKDVATSVGFENFLEEAEKIYDLTLKNLNIPKNAVEVDVFGYAYKVKNGKIKDASSMFKYVNLGVKLFKENDMLCLADSVNVWGIPISNIKRIAKIEKTVSFSGWNKNEPANKGRYKQFKVRANNYGIYFIKPYFIMQIVSGSQEFEILIPSYDVEEFIKLTNISYTQN